SWIVLLVLVCVRGRGVMEDASATPVPGATRTKPARRRGLRPAPGSSRYGSLISNRSETGPATAQSDVSTTWPGGRDARRDVFRGIVPGVVGMRDAAIDADGVGARADTHGTARTGRVVRDLRERSG